YKRQTLYRAQHRGMKEADIFIGAFAVDRLETMTDDQHDRFEALLEEHDADIMDWIMGRAEPPVAYRTDVMDMLRTFKLHP
ncbi:MAG TPA: succinate dehydrogenase assembly factor 2, partial [Rhodospirillum rubrum]|nr:succinate dehydrogenase assembly factor 2 [Rhodospirillum rubrum]